MPSQGSVFPTAIKLRQLLEGLMSIIVSNGLPIDRNLRTYTKGEISVDALGWAHGHAYHFKRQLEADRSLM